MSEQEGLREGEEWIERRTEEIILYGQFSLHESYECSINSITEYVDLRKIGKLLE